MINIRYLLYSRAGRTAECRAWGSPTLGGLQALERTVRPFGAAWTAASPSQALVPDPVSRAALTAQRLMHNG
eukprot:1870045-Alexandrium_andersonii.AAC.1